MEDALNTSRSSVENEKQKAAISSVLAAIFLTLIKIVVGISTNSIGILSEAAHSGLDLVAAAVTFFAVKMSDTPPDKRHLYGHGKVENLSALIETVLLLATCVWIVYESSIRIFVTNEHVEASGWSFLVMGISIVVDFTRSRMLLKTAKKHNSQALEADALHFSTDIWSSCVVIVGLVCIVIGEKFNVNSSFREYLFKADAIAALFVAGIVAYVSVKMGRKAIDALIDAVPHGVEATIRISIESLPGVLSVQSLRIRQSGPIAFVDMILQIPRVASLEEAHIIAEEAEKLVQETLPSADTIVHIEPISMNTESIVESIRALAARKGIGVHGIRVHQVRNTLYLEMHIEVSEDLNLEDAHKIATSFEQDVYSSIPDVTSIMTHIEPVGDGASFKKSEQINIQGVVSKIERICKDSPDIVDCHHITILGSQDRPSISFHCRMAKETPIIYAHKVTAVLEATIHLWIPGLDRIIIHLEPMK